MIPPLAVAQSEIDDCRQGSELEYQGFPAD